MRCFNGHPPLGVNATWCGDCATAARLFAGFNGHPPLGVNATWVTTLDLREPSEILAFQWAPTLGGECYDLGLGELESKAIWFQWAPTLGGECYETASAMEIDDDLAGFQWAPTLGGECYGTAYRPCGDDERGVVSMGTHPWG